MSAPETGTAEHLVFITGRLARPRLEKIAASLPAHLRWSIADAGVKVAALMTEEIIKRRVEIPEGATRIVLPGRCRANPEALAAHFGLPVERGRMRSWISPLGSASPDAASTCRATTCGSSPRSSMPRR